MTEASITQRELDGGEIQPTTPFNGEVSKGNVKNHSNIFIRGLNEAVGSTTEDISTDGLIYVWPQAAINLEVISDDLNDTALGSGVRSVLIDGLDSNWERISEVVAMNGVSASTATTNKFLRVNSVSAATHGTYGGTLDGGNAGSITVRTSGAGQTHATILNNSDFGFGISTSGRFTVPKDFSLLINHIVISIDAQKIGNLFIKARANNESISQPFSSVLTTLPFSTDTGLSIPLETPAPFSERTDIWMAANAEVANTAITGSLSGILYRFRT